MQTEQIEVKKKNTATKGVEGNGILEKDMNVKTDKYGKIDFNPVISSSPKVNKDKQKKGELKVDVVKCSKCEYQTKKEATLKKHIITHHEDHVCKECNEKLNSFMKLLNHIAKHHPKEPAEEKGIKDSGEKDTQNKHVEKEKVDNKDKELVVGVSMLDTSSS